MKKMVVEKKKAVIEDYHYLWLTYHSLNRNVRAKDIYLIYKICKENSY